MRELNLVKLILIKILIKNQRNKELYQRKNNMNKYCKKKSIEKVNVKDANLIK